MPPKKRSKVEVVWEWKNDDGTWVAYSDEDIALLEKSYKSPTNRSKQLQTTELSFNKGYDTKYIFDFKKWTQLNTSSSKERTIRRRGGDSDNEDEEEDGEYVWEWKDDSDIFVAFYDDDVALLEKAYRKAPGQEFKTTDLSFNVHHKTPYVFDFKKGTQFNTESNKVRIIRRVPKDTKGWSIKGYGIQSQKETSAPAAGAPSSFPAHWSAPVGTCDMVPVVKDSKEWNDTLKTFIATLGHKPTIISLTRIQNYMLWQFYSLTRSHIATRNGGDPNELTLFHGARVRANMDAIINFGFDMRVAAQGSVGSGIYFAVNASYSNGGYVLQNKDKSKEMFICKVTCGSGVQGNPTLRRPPPKDASKPTGDLYDSVFNGAIMHVVFNNSQAYPEYLVKYK